ncbi:MAG: hypothetical protein ABJA64_02320 [Candidatus Saccharibacteria bacterium]
MASDRNQFNRALKKWDMLHEAGNFGASVRNGELAVLCSSYSNRDTPNERLEERGYFEREAHQMVCFFRGQGMGAFVINKLSFDDAIDVIKDTSVSSIVTIGHGDLSSIYIDREHKLDWGDVSRESTHLKTGVFTQRQCGQFLRDLSVPMGTFVMANHKQVHAVAGDSFTPENYGPREEDKIKPLHSEERLSYRTIKWLFERQEFEKNDES